MHSSPTPRARALRLAATAGLALLAACNDDGTGARTPVEPPPATALAALTCDADVRAGTLTCGALGSGGGISASAAPAGGPSLVQHVLGGQGQYVRLTSSGAAYGDNVFLFNVTVQNLSNLALGTSDGATRDDAGVRVFFHQGPTVTGGTGTITVANATGTAAFTAAGQPYFQYGGKVGGVDQGELGADGILASAETSTSKDWRLNVPATVTTFTFVVYVSTQTPAGTVSSLAPQVTSVSPATLVPGSTATITGVNFNASLGSNVVTIGGQTATVTGGSGTTQLTVTVPCTSTGTVPVQVTQGGMKGAALEHPLQVANRRTLGVGQSVVAATSADALCNEIVASNADSRYVVAVFNASTSPGSSTGFRVASDDAPAGAGALASKSRAAAPRAVRAPSLDEQLARARALTHGDRHARLLEKSARANERLRARFAGDARMRPRRSAVAADPVPPPATRSFRVSNIDADDICTSYFNVTATRVYYSGKVAIYEDDATPAALKASANAAMAAYYQKIGDQYNADMEPIIRNNFGDPLLRDAVTDNNGVMIALFTPLLNTNFPGVAGFVVSCDEYPNDASNSASNFGQVFYAYQPEVAGTGYAAETPDAWYWTIRAVFIHETKHVASNTARVAASASLERAWLEEGTAMHAEELWARNSVYNVGWKGNTGYGSAAAPGSLYCDVRPSSAACSAGNPRRPSMNMFDHFSSLYTVLEYPELLSPYGPSNYDDAGYFYSASWSLVRYAVDRYGASDAAFLSALNQSTATGQANLAARAGVPIEQVLGGWALAMFADDYPGLSGAGADTQFPTWNFRNVFAGLNADFPADFPLAYPVYSEELGLGSFGTVNVPTIVGGGVVYFTLTGSHTQAQLLRLQSTLGGAPSAALRVAIARVQ